MWKICQKLWLTTRMLLTGEKLLILSCTDFTLAIATTAWVTFQNATALILWVHGSLLIWKSFHAHLQLLCSYTNWTWPVLLYILPGDKMFPNRIHCYILEHQNPTTNDFYHTHVVVPEQRDMCNSLKGSCNSPNCAPFGVLSNCINSAVGNLQNTRRDLYFMLCPEKHSRTE